MFYYKSITLFLFLFLFLVLYLRGKRGLLRGNIGERKHEGKVYAGE